MRTNEPFDLLALNRRAVEHSIEIVSRVVVDDLSRPTPCGDWTISDLLSHMVAQHNGFAAAAAGETTDLSVWETHPVGPTPVQTYADATRRVLDAFAAHDPERGFWLPEIRDGGPFPASMAIGMHLVDYVVHGWDVATSLGDETGFDDQVIDAALRIAEQVPGGAAREVEGAAFGPILTSTTAATPMDRLLLTLGRRP